MLSSNNFCILKITFNHLLSLLLYYNPNKNNDERTFRKMQDTYETFKANATLQLEKQNKAAGTRARKDSLILEKLAKEFRKASLEASKK